MKAAASATKEGDHGNRKKKGHLQFISNFEVCENHSPTASNQTDARSLAIGVPG